MKVGISPVFHTTRPAGAYNNVALDEISLLFYSTLNMPLSQSLHEYISSVRWRGLIGSVHTKISQSHRTDTFSLHTIQVPSAKTCQTCTQTHSITSVVNLFINHKGVLNHNYPHISVSTCKHVIPTPHFLYLTCVRLPFIFCWSEHANTPTYNHTPGNQ